MVDTIFAAVAWMFPWRGSEVLQVMLQINALQGHFHFSFGTEPALSRTAQSMSGSLAGGSG
jgi:hypothetical protein